MYQSTMPIWCVTSAGLARGCEIVLYRCCPGPGLSVAWIGGHSRDSKILPVLIVLAAMLTMSMAFIVVYALAGIRVYLTTESLEVGLACRGAIRHPARIIRILFT